MPMTKKGEGKDQRVVLHLHPKIAPITVAIFPLVKKEGMPEKAAEIEQGLAPSISARLIEENQSIGRRYRRQDEIGTPFCITVDGETMSEGTVTLRERDSMAQERVAIDELRTVLEEKIASWRRPEARVEASATS